MTHQENNLELHVNIRRLFTKIGTTTCRLVQMARSINCFPTRTIQCRSFAWDSIAQLPTLTPEPAVISEPLTAFQPAEPATTEQEGARNTLINFFDDLSRGNYTAAVALFEGEVDDYLRDPLPDESMEAYWEYLCAYL